VNPAQTAVGIGQRRALSVSDIVQTRLLYNCPSQIFRVFFAQKQIEMLTSIRDEDKGG